AQRLSAGYQLWQASAPGATSAGVSARGGSGGHCSALITGICLLPFSTAARRRPAVHALVASARAHGQRPAVGTGRGVPVDHEGQLLAAVGDRVLDDQLDLLRL